MVSVHVVRVSLLLHRSALHSTPPHLDLARGILEREEERTSEPFELEYASASFVDIQYRSLEKDCASVHYRLGE
jgi:hypothetical protein